MADKRAGLRGPDKSQGHLRDARQGAYDPVGNTRIPDTNLQTAHESAQPGADVRGEPAPAHSPTADDVPEGLKRERKGPLNKSDGRGEQSSHLPSHAPVSGIGKK
jgi:hypothetical protein